MSSAAGTGALLRKQRKELQQRLEQTRRAAQQQECAIKALEEQRQGTVLKAEWVRLLLDADASPRSTPSSATTAPANFTRRVTLATRLTHADLTSLNGEFGVIVKLAN